MNFTRRNFLKTAGLLSVAGFMTACGADKNSANNSTAEANELKSKVFFTKKNRR